MQGPFDSMLVGLAFVAIGALRNDAFRSCVTSRPEWLKGEQSTDFRRFFESAGISSPKTQLTA
jgi:hypothetical protein